jgi:hypothetical protein
MPSSAILRSVEWEFRTEVADNPINSIFKGHEVLKDFFPSLRVKASKNTSLTLKTGPIGRPETSLRNYH